jgi:putative ABC transport system permease protein
MSMRSDNFRLAYRSLRAAKARSFLTMLGIIIGVAAVVLVVCIGQGVKQQISGQLGRYGKSVFTVQPGAPNAGIRSLSGLSAGSSGLLSENDLRTVQKTTGVINAVPLSTVSGSMSGDRTVQTPFILATNTDFTAVINPTFASGGFFESDVDSKTVVLGQTIAKQLFNDNAPLGQTLTWRGQQFIVAGVFNDFRAPPFSLEANFNDAVFIPYSTAQTLSGNVLGIYQILAKSSDVAQTQQTVDRVRAALYSSHGGSHDVTVTKASSTSTASDQTVHLLTLLVAGAAIIALIVGCIGIMDVMLVSVTERMHEIGLRKAIGATNRQIMRQFMAEAFLLSTIGALIGLVVACIAVGLLRAFTSLQAVLVWQVLVFAPVIAVITGVIFGSMPALKAARKDPIEALRHE